jgi:hypothetical protein
MSLYSRFGATYTDVLAEFPGAAANDFAGPGGADGQARIEAALDQAELTVVAALPAALRRRLDRVEGVEIVRSAAASQSSVTLPLAVAAAPDLVLWRNWPRAFWPLLPARSAALAEGTAWTRSGQAITLQAGWELAGGDNLIASWSHAAAAADSYLAGLAVGLARALLAGRVFRPSEGGYEAANARWRECREELARLGDGRAAVPALGRLVFVADRPALALERA